MVNDAAKIRTVLLDLGNVLVFHDNARLARNMAEAVGRPVSDVEAWGQRSTDAINLGQLDGPGIHQSFLTELKVSPDQLPLGRFAALFASHFTLHAEVLPLIETLRARIPRLALLSNTNALHVEFLRPRLPILERFDALLFSNEVGKVKPDPGFYLEALRRTGSRPDETLFFDDLSPYVDAARQLGIHGCVFTTAKQFENNLTEFGVSLTSGRSPP